MTGHAHELPDYFGELSELIERAASEGVVYLTRDGLPVAKIVPVQPDPEEARTADLLREFPEPTIADFERFTLSLGVDETKAHEFAVDTATWRKNLLDRYPSRSHGAR